MDVIDTVTGDLKPIAKDEPGVSLEYLAGAQQDAQAVSYIRKESGRKQFVLVRHDLKSGVENKQDVLPLPHPDANYAFALGGDRKWLGYFRAERDESGESLFRVARRRLQTGEEVELIRSIDFLRPRPNADDRQLAVGMDKEKDELQVRFFDLTTEPPREQFTVQLPPPASLGWWTPDYRYLWFEKRVGTSSDLKTELWTISAKNGEVNRTELSMPGLRMAFVHPNGKQVFFQAETSSLNEIWVMENLLPPVAAAK